MATTLVGMFDSLADAERARDMLLRDGIAAGAVHLTNNESIAARSTKEDHRGFFARLFDLGDNDTTVGTYSEAVRRGSAMLTVTLPDAADCSHIETLLESAGAIDVNERAAKWGLGRDTAAAGSAARGDTLKVVQEELNVGKRAVEKGGVRVRQFVTERPVQEQVQLCEERAIVERRPVDRVLSAEEANSLDLRDREIELRERAEVPVVQKQARVVEEVRVGKEANVRSETVEDTVRRTDVDVEQLTAAQQAQRQGSTLRNPPPR